MNLAKLLPPLFLYLIFLSFTLCASSVDDALKSEKSVPKDKKSSKVRDFGLSQVPLMQTGFKHLKEITNNEEKQKKPSKIALEAIKKLSDRQLKEQIEILKKREEDEVQKRNDLKNKFIDEVEKFSPEELKNLGTPENFHGNQTIKDLDASFDLLKLSPDLRKTCHFNSKGDDLSEAKKRSQLGINLRSSELLDLNKLKKLVQKLYSETQENPTLKSTLELSGFYFKGTEEEKRELAFRAFLSSGLIYKKLAERNHQAITEMDMDIESTNLCRRNLVDMAASGAQTLKYAAILTENKTRAHFLLNLSRNLLELSQNNLHYIQKYLENITSAYNHLKTFLKPAYDQEKDSSPMSTPLKDEEQFIKDFSLLVEKPPQFSIDQSLVSYAKKKKEFEDRVFRELEKEVVSGLVSHKPNFTKGSSLVGSSPSQTLIEGKHPLKVHNNFEATASNDWMTENSSYMSALKKRVRKDFGYEPSPSHETSQTFVSISAKNDILRLLKSGKKSMSNEVLNEKISLALGISLEALKAFKEKRFNENNPEKIQETIDREKQQINKLMSENLAVLKARELTRQLVPLFQKELMGKELRFSLQKGMKKEENL